MKRLILIFFSVSFTLFACSRGEDLTTKIDITQYSWKVKSITVDGVKTKTPKKNYRGNEITIDKAYELFFNNDSTIDMNLSVNSSFSRYEIEKKGEISIDLFGTTEVCCDSDFDENLIRIIPKIKIYKVFSNTLFLIGDDVEVELEKN